MRLAPREVDTDEALKHCAAEPVHIPGAIQGHGAIVAIDNESLQITHASRNLEDLTGISASEALGLNVNDVFPTGLRHDLVNGLLPEYLGLDTRQMEPITLNDRALLAGSAQAGGATIFEFEPATAQGNVTGSAMQQLAFLTSQLHAVENADMLFEKSVKLLKVFTGYHRIMVYVFDSEGNGSIRAEALSGRRDSFLGLSFPAWDIPAQAREIMKRTPLRYIADVGAGSVPVLASRADHPPLDMTHSHLRGVPAVHLQYLRNMGTASTFTLNVVMDGQLWGMISLHHDVPRIPDQKTRELCRNFVRFFSLKLDTILQRERLDRLQHADRLRKELTATAAGGGADIRFNTSLLESLCIAMQADGALLSKDGQLQSCGLVPSDTGQRQLLKFGKTLDGPLHSSAVHANNPDVAACLGPEIAGLHLTPMQGDSLVAFFRRDREREVTWAGAPTKTIEGQGADARLRPRGSFLAYKETVRGTSAPWKPEHHQIARDVWSILINSERQALIEKTTRQQKMLIDELNHRVRNILTLIRSLSRQSQYGSDTIEDYVAALESRIEAVATAHSLAVEKPSAFVSINDILRLEAKAHNASGTHVEISGDDVGLNPENAPIFALVMHELMTNAAKYGALSTPAGRVLIHLEMSEGHLALHWTETGGPAVSPPSRQGFGTNLLQNSVRTELRGSIKQGFAETGFTATLTLPADLLNFVRHVRNDTGDRAVPDIPQTAGDVFETTRAAQACLLVEDSFVVSLDTMRIMNEVGFEEVQTAMTVAEARQAIARVQLGFAILDVNLSGGQTSFGVARDLMELSVPFVFVTGYGVDGVPEGLFPGVPVLRKPLRRMLLEQVLAELGL